MDESTEHDLGGVEPETTGSAGKQAEGEPTDLVIVTEEAPEIGHVGALLKEHSDSEQVFNRAVALAALSDAEASRRFVQGQLESFQQSNEDLRESLQAATTKVAVLDTTIRMIRASKWTQQLSFGIGAAMLGAGLGIALSSGFGALHLVAIGLGALLMVVGVLDPFGRD